MNIFPLIGFSRAPMDGVRLPRAAAVLMAVIAISVAASLPAAAQMEYDYNEDGKVTCADFEEEFPETFTDEATKALQQYPDDLRRLNGNSEDNAIACEGQPAVPVAAEPSPTPQTPEPSPDAGVAESSPTETVDVPADVMARVEGCAVIAISSRDVVGAGCPGVGAVTFRIPDDAPSMTDTVIMTPRASLATEASGAQGSTAATGSNESTQNEKETAKAGKDKKNQAADDAKTDKDKKNKDKKEKSNKNKKKNGKNKNTKNGKKGKK